MAQRETNLHTQNECSGFPELDPLIGELAWEDISNLAHTYFIDDLTPLATEAIALGQTNTNTLSDSKPPLASVQSHSSHFAYQSRNLLWDPTPVAPEIARADFHTGVDSAFDQQNWQDTSSGSLSRNAAAQSSCDHVEPPNPQQHQYNQPDSPQTQHQRAPETTQARQERTPSYQHQTPAERKAAVNRLAQKTFRTKQKARAKAVEAQLVNATTELQELKERHAKLEARHLLLEKVSQINKQSDKLSELPATVDPMGKHFVNYETNVTEQGREFIITVNGSQQSMSMHEMEHMTLPEFARLWTEYIRQLGSLLVSQSNHPSAATQQRLEQLTVETSQLIGVTKPLNTTVYKAVLAGRLDEGLTGSHVHRLDEAWYSELPSLLALSQQQVEDILLLRRLYLLKRGTLAAERDAVAEEIQASKNIPSPSPDALVQLSELSARLQKIASEDYGSYVKIACAFRRGIFTTEQWVVMIVYAYPFFYALDSFLDSLALQYGEPSAQEIMTKGYVPHMDAQFAHMDEYLWQITRQYRHEYVPLPSTVRDAYKSAVPTPVLGSGQGATLRDMLF